MRFSWVFKEIFEELEEIFEEIFEVLEEIEELEKQDSRGF